MRPETRVVAVDTIVLLLLNGGAVGFGYCCAVAEFQERLSALFLPSMVLMVFGNFALGYRMRSARARAGDVRK